MYKVQSPTPSRNPQYYADQVQLIAAEAIRLESVENFTWRDVAVAMDLWQRYIEIMEELEATGITGDESVVITLTKEGVETGVNLKLKSVGQIAEWINNGDKEP